MGKMITETEFKNAQQRGDVGVYKNFFGKHPEWKGLRTISLPEDDMFVRIEGVTFMIVPDNYVFKAPETTGFMADFHTA